MRRFERICPFMSKPTSDDKDVCKFVECIRGNCRAWKKGIREYIDADGVSVRDDGFCALIEK